MNVLSITDAPSVPNRRAQGASQRLWRSLFLLFILLASVSLLTSGCHSTRYASQRAGRYDTTPRLAILSAFEPELEKLRQQTKITEVRVINGRNYYVGHLP